MNTRKLTFIGMLIAVSVVLVWLIHFPIFPAVAFLEYDPADIPILIASCALGPVYGLIVTLAASLVQGVTVSAASGVYGILMHLIATSAYVTVASLLYRRRRTRGGLGLALGAGTLAMAAVMVPANLLITPFFMGTTAAVVAGLLPFIILFNLVKAGINAVAVFALYAPLGRRVEALLH